MSDAAANSPGQIVPGDFLPGSLKIHLQLLQIALCLVLISLLLSGCAGTSPQLLPAVRAEANRSNERGVEAARLGDTAAAQRGFYEAYRGYASVEYYPGMVTALLNTARINTNAGNFAVARTALAEARQLTDFVPSLTSEVCFEQAKLFVREGRTAEALPWGERAVNSAGDAAKGRMTNLLADIVHRLGDRGRAESLAKAGLALSMHAGERQETANALRLLAEIALEGGDTPLAESRFNEALSLDKELASSSRIAADLQGLARTAEKAGMRDKEVDFWERYVNVSLAASDRTGAAAGLERIAKIREQSGDTEAALKARSRITDIMKSYREDAVKLNP